MIENYLQPVNIHRPNLQGNLSPKILILVPLVIAALFGLVYANSHTDILRVATHRPAPNSDIAPVLECLDETYGAHAAKAGIGGADPDGIIVSASVMWGDGQSNTALVSGPYCAGNYQYPIQWTSSWSHSYLNAGTYTIMEWLTDNAGLTSSETWTVTVTGSSGTGAGSSTSGPAGTYPLRA